MSDYASRYIYPELWDKILKQHWLYFGAEEGEDKLKRRKKLEDSIKDFLCINQHDGKFILTETANVLKNSIENLGNFNAQNAITAFESISQYADNLYMKTWRKEFRILKMYSGFYQHEIKSNLLGAEILFETMGYRRFSKDILILDGPICPDAVANVSRDALIAYVELQIIKHIQSGLAALGLNCSWLDIYRYRETHTGGAVQAIKDLAYSIGEKRFRCRPKALPGDNYSYIDEQPASNYFSESQQFGTPQCQCNLYQQVPTFSRQRVITRPNDICCITDHHQDCSKKLNLVCNNMSYPNHHQYIHSHQHHNAGIPSDSGRILLPQMSHSRSLEHYSESNHGNMLPHRHSFDQQQQGCTSHHQYHNSSQQHYYQHLNRPSQNFYESPYDCIDGNSLGGGSSTISYAAVATNSSAGPVTIDGGAMGTNYNLNSSSTYSHPYNVSGNRFPLPINISNQLSAYENIKSNNYNGLHEPTYAHISEQNMYSPIPKLLPNLKNKNIISNVHAIQNSLPIEDSIQRRCCQSEQLINFEDQTILPVATPQQKFDQYRCNLESSDHLIDKQYNTRNILENAAPSITSIWQQHCSPCKSATNDTIVYAKPTPRENRKPNGLNVLKYQHNSADRYDTTDLSYESANEEFGNLPNESIQNQQSSPTQFKKNQEGVGSSEQWCYVYQKLKMNEHSNVVDERNDLLVQSLDLDSLNINNDNSPSQSSSAEKRRSYHSGNENQTDIQLRNQQHQQSELKQKIKTLENAKNLAQINAKIENLSSTSSTNSTQKKRTSTDNNGRKVKSALKQINATTSKNARNINKVEPKTNDNKTSKTMNYNNNNNLAISSNGTAQRQILNVKKTPLPSAQDIAISVNEWSCSFCTFLNPDKERICEMCGHTKDFHLESSKSSTALTHNTPTCA